MTLEDFYRQFAEALRTVHAGELRTEGLAPRLRVSVRRKGPGTWGAAPAVTDPMGAVYFAKTQKLVDITKTPVAGLALGLSRHAVVTLALASDVEDPGPRRLEVPDVRRRLIALLEAHFRPPKRG